MGPNQSEATGAALFSFEDFIRLLKRGWLRIATCVVVALLAAGIFSQIQTKMYEVSATLLVKFGREFVTDPTSDAGRLVGRSRESLLNSEIEILLSQSVADLMLESIPALEIYPDLAEAAAATQRPLAAERIGRGLRAGTLKETELIRAHFSHPDPEVAVRVLNGLLAAFRQRHLETFSEVGAAGVLEQALGDDMLKLAEAEKELQAFEVEHASFSVQDPGDLLVRQRFQIQAAIRDAEGLIATARRQNLTEPTTLGRARADLLDLELERNTLRRQYEDTSDPVKAVDEQIAMLRSLVEDQWAEAKQARGASLSPLLARRNSLSLDLVAIDQQIEQIPQLSGQHRQLVRRRDGIETRLASLSTRLERHRVSMEMERQQLTNIRMVQLPVLPTIPVRPRPVLNLLAGAVAGLVLGLILAYLQDDERPVGPGGQATPREDDHRVALPPEPAEIVVEAEPEVPPMSARYGFAKPQPRAEEQAASHPELDGEIEALIRWPQPRVQPSHFSWERTSSGHWARVPAVVQAG